MKTTAIILVSLFCLSIVSASCIDFYYRDDCPHCQQVKPLVNQLFQQYPKHNWNFFDIYQEGNSEKLSEYSEGVPTVVIDNHVVLSGSQEIPRWLPCYAQQMTTRECPTLSADHSTKDWFLK